MIILHSVSDPQLPMLLKQGKVGVVPTDTIYGLASLASNAEGMARIYSLKQRENKLGTFIAANIEQLIAIGLDEESLRSVAHLWPNPISVVVSLKTGQSFLDLGKGSLAVRIPKDEQLLQLLESTGALATSSANLFSQPENGQFEVLRQGAVILDESGKIIQYNDAQSDR
jgi:L-threonylcarbamoyladenylate synthase